MNLIQRGISAISLFVIALMVLFPPSVTYEKFGGSGMPEMPGSGLREGEQLIPIYQYKYILEATIDAPVLMAQINAVLAITGLLIILFWDKK